MKTESGFTLIELMFTLIVAGVVLALAGAGFSSLMRTNLLAAQTNDLVSALSIARSEAATRSANVSVCASNTGAACTATDWQDGWIVFTDGNTAGAVDGTDQILKVFPAARSITITGSGFANAHYLQYRGTGRADSSGAFTICSTEPGLEGRAISVSTTGRIGIQATASCP